MLREPLKQAFLFGSKWSGLFLASRRITRGSLRILCYHGTAAGDVAKFRPTLFIGHEAFERRLAYLRAKGFRVLDLEEAVARLEAGELPADSVVITFDDGFASTFRWALKALARHGLPATVYVTSYYAQKETPVFRLLLQYLFWATQRKELDLEALGITGWSGWATLSEDREADPTLWRLIEHGEERLEEPGRQALARRAAGALGVDLDSVVQGRWLSLMTRGEIREAASLGVDVQLHTHRHRFPEDPRLARREVRENRAALEPLVGRRLNHLCYPSGVYSERHFDWLAQDQIRSATTCDVGFNDPGAHPLALKRIFDGSVVSQLQFEAEVNGFLELIRRARASLRRLRGREAPPPGSATRSPPREAEAAAAASAPA